MIYNITYHRHDKKITETKQVNADTMQEAVKIIVTRATRANVKISKISCTVDGSSGIQKFCDECLVNEARYGFKGNIMKCWGCKI